MTILFYTGMRPIELFAMDTKQVNVPSRWITIPRTKIGESRGVPMHEALVPMLTDIVKNRSGRLMLTWCNKPYKLSDDRGVQIHRAITAARLRTHIFDVAPYTGRHTASTQLVVNGIHPYIKDQILGHAVDDMSRNYVNVPQPKLIESINTLPTIQEWLNQDWMRSPVKLWSRRSQPMTEAEMAAGGKALLAWNDVRRAA
jgi:integrase